MAITITEVSKFDLPNSGKAGTYLRRIIAIVRVTTDSTGNTLDLATYFPGVADIEGIVWETIDSAVAATNITWSTSTITFAGHTGSGVTELGVMCVLT